VNVSKIGRWINRLVYLIFLFMMVIGIVVNFTFYESNFSYGKRAFLAVFAALFLLGNFILLNKFLKLFSDWTLKIMLVAVFFAYLLFEIYLLSSFTPSIINDAFRMQVDSLALAERKLTGWSIYYKMFSQNVLPSVFYAFCFRILIFFKFNAVQMFKIVCLLMNSTLYVSLLCCVRIVSQKWSTTILAGISLFFVPYLWTYNLWILYTDTPLMFAWTVLAVCWWIFVHNDLASRKSFPFWALLTFVVVTFGQLMKASFIASGLFAIFYLLIHMFNFPNLKHFPKKIGLLSVVLGVALWSSFPIGRKIEKRVHFVPDENYAYPLKHWVAMGLNQNSKGRFEIDDLKGLQNFLTKEKKEREVDKLLKKRFWGQSPKRLFWQYVNKFGVLLYGGQIHNRFQIGFQRAPTWYQNHAFIIYVLQGVFSQGYLLLLYAFAFRRIWKAFFLGEFGIMVPVLIVLGINFFYGLIWEVNSRYAEVILGPLLMIVTAPNLPPTLKRVKIWQKIPLISVFALSALIFFKTLGATTIDNVVKKYENEKKNRELGNRLFLPVLGNCSNYKMMYGRENVDLEAKKEIVQRVEITGKNFYSLRVFKKINQRGTFILKYRGREIFSTKKLDPKKLCQEECSLKINRKQHFEPGVYELIWRNTTKKKIRIVLQASEYYPLSKYQVTGLKTNVPYYLMYNFAVRAAKREKF